MNSFLVTNNLGGYLWYSKEPFSRYQGWYMRFGDRIVKLLDSIEGEYNALHFPKYYKSLIITGSHRCPLRFIFDIREPYETPQWGKEYRIIEKNGIIWVYESIKKFIIGIKIDGGYRIINNWKERVYPFDKKRQSLPYSLWVYEGLEVMAKKTLIAAGQNEEEIIKELARASRFRFKKPPTYLKLKKDVYSDTLAYHLAKYSLLSLRVYNDKRKIIGLYAGLPWFFQFWFRDEAISAYALSRLVYKEARDILLARAGNIKTSPCPSFIDLKGVFSGSKSIDAPLWIFFRIKNMRIKKEVRLPLDTRLILNDPYQTWMDSIPREGARIEVQALKLAFLQGTPLEDEFCQRVRKEFFIDGVLADGIDKNGTHDKTFRPNCFLVYYLYPKLLTSEEWERVFDNLLAHLWIPWGGIATLDKAHPQFHGEHTGEDHVSYHQGDSWFWINNIAAMALLRLQRDKYTSYIKRIFYASARDILSEGIPGHASELSSANEFSPAGSLVQLWSAATFIELYHQMQKSG